MMIPSAAYDVAYNESSRDQLGDILRLQSVLMDLLQVSQDDQKKSLLEAGIGMACESAEVLDRLNKANRPWKTGTIDLVEIVKEAIDVLFYTFEIFNLIGLNSDDIETMFVRKFAFNCARVFESELVTSRFQALALLKKIRNPSSEYATFPVPMKAAYWLRELEYLSKEDEMTDMDMQMIYNPCTTVIRIQDGKLL